MYIIQYFRAQNALYEDFKKLTLALEHCIPSLVTHLGCWIPEEAGKEGGGGVWGAGSIRKEREPVGECCVPVKRLHENQMSHSKQHYRSHSKEQASVKSCLHT